MGKDGRLHIHQKDTDFVYHLYDLFDTLEIVGATPKECKSVIKPSGNTRVSYVFATFTLPFFTELHKRWYKKIDGKNRQV